MYVSHIVTGANTIRMCLIRLLEQTVSHMVIGAGSICMCLKWLLEQTPIVYLNSVDKLVFAPQNVVFTVNQLL
jgi:hypothetical protein